MAYTDDWENLMNGVFGAGGRPRFGGTAQPEAKPQKSGTPAVPDLNAALLETRSSWMPCSKSRMLSSERRMTPCSLH